MIEFTVHHTPVAQPRQRFSARGGFARAYTPKDHPVNAYKEAVREAFKAVYKGEPMKGAITLDVSFHFPRPKNQIWKTKPMPTYPHIKKPDVDNLEKSLMDSLNGTAWVDDSQVFRIFGEKWVVGKNQEARVEVSLLLHDN